MGGSGFVTNHTQLLNECIACYPANHRHAGANLKKKHCLRGVMISAIKTLPYKLFLPVKEALSLLFLQNVECVQACFVCSAASVQATLKR
jgi:hypothetical protein